MPIQWNQQLYGTGNEKIDAQHRQIFERANALEQILNETGRAADFRYVIDFLCRYVREHFRCEESVMERRRCSACKENKKAHERFIYEFELIKQRFLAEGSSESLMRETCQFLNSWLRLHIMAVDTKLREAAPPPAEGQP